MLSSIIERLKKKRQRRINIQKTITLIFPILLISFLFILLIPPVSAYDIVVENNVDSDSDIDTTANKGDDGATSYLDAQTLDDMDQVIVEADFPASGIDEYLVPDDVEADNGLWDIPVGTSPYIDAQDQPTNYIWTDANGESTGWFSFGATSGSGTGFTVNMSYYHQSDTDSYSTWELDWTGDGNSDANGQATFQGVFAWEDFGTITELDTATEIDACRIRFTYNKGSGGPDDHDVDAARIGVSKAGSSNYQLEWEHQVQSVDNDKTEYLLCIYGYSSSVTESFEVQMWNFGGTQWDTALITTIDNSEQWYNQTISSSYIDGSDQITYRFRGTIESSDITQDTLYIDWSGVRAYNFSVYGLPATFDSLEFSPDSNYHAFTDSPLEFVVESGKTYDVQIKGSDNTGTAVVDGFIYYNTVDDTGSASVLTTSYVVFYNDQSAGNNIHSIYIWVNWGWSGGDSGVTGGTRSFDIDIQIINA